MEKLVVGLVGPLGSGKTTVAEYLVSQGYFSLKFSQLIDKEIARRGIERTRAVQQDIGDRLRAEHGLDYIGKLLVTDINLDKKHTKFVVEGFRNPSEVNPFRELDNFILIGLNADPIVRFERLVKRKQDRDPKDWEAFQQQEARDQGIAQPSHGQNVLGSLELADFIVDTDSPIEEVYNKIIKVIEEAKNDFKRKASSGSEECDFC